MGMDATDWEWIAYELGFMFDDRKMIETLYPPMTLEALATKLGISAKTLTDRMDALGIKRRPAGDRIDKFARVPQGPKLPGSPRSARVGGYKSRKRG